MPSLTLEDIKPGSEIHHRIITEVRRRVRMWERATANRRRKWRQAEDEIVAYVPESEADARRRHTRELKGVPSYTTIKIPYTYAVAMSYWTYFSTVFLSRTPVLQFDGRHGETQQQVLMLEALQDYQTHAGRQMVPLFCWLYDVSRYGTGIISVYWQQDYRHVTEIVENQDPLTGEYTKESVTLELKGYHGNEVCNIQPRDFIFDTRLPLNKFQNGEFAGCRTKLSWLQLKQREYYGFYTNLNAIDAQIPSRFTDERDDDSSVEKPDEDFLEQGMYSFTGGASPNPDIVPIYEVFVELIPSDWGFGSSSFPEKWVFTITADWRTVIGAQPHGAHHCRYPYCAIELEPDAYALASRGLPEILSGVQQTMDWLVNVHMFNVRASVNNLFVVDPSRVVLKDLTSPNPGGLIRLRPGGANLPTPPVTQLSVADITRQNFTDFQAFQGIGERASGVSDPMMGAITKTGRRTATEVRTSSVAGGSRQKITTEFMSAMGWDDLATQQVGNSQQYYDDELVLKITGNLARMAGAETLKVTPDDILGNYRFVPVDGTLPMDRFAQANLFKELLLGFKQIPELALRYDIGKIFEWIMQLSGQRNIEQFRIEVQDNATLQNDATAGRVVPLAGRRGNPELLRQVSGNVGPIPVGGGGL